jgi:hypothetical protein
MTRGSLPHGATGPTAGGGLGRGRKREIEAGAREYWADPPFDEMEVTLGQAQELHGLLPGTRIPFDDGAWQLDRAEAGYD